MASWILALIPATVNGNNVLLHLWSNGPDPTNWAAATPPVSQSSENVSIVLHQNNNTHVFPGHENVSLVDLSTYSGSATTSITAGEAPFVGGQQASPSNGVWMWPGTSLAGGTHYKFTVQLEVDGQHYAVDPQMIVKSG